MIVLSQTTLCSLGERPAERVVALERHGVVAGLDPRVGQFDVRDVLDVLTPHERVAEVAVPDVLVLVERVRLGLVHPAARSDDLRPGPQVDRHVALEVERGGRGVGGHGRDGHDERRQRPGDPVSPHRRGPSSGTRVRRGRRCNSTEKDYISERSDAVNGARPH
jgi:hypothetical protein